MRTYPLSRGFSLIELIVVIGILSVVLSLGSTMFFDITNAGNHSARVLRVEEIANQAFSTLRRDFTQMLSSESAGSTISGEDRETQDDQLAWGMSLANDRVTLPVSTKNPRTNLVEEHSVLYRIGRDGSGSSRLERLQTPLNEMNPDGPVQVVAGGVTAMDLEYHDGVSWRPSWDKRQAPEAVRISLTLMSENYPMEQISRKAAFTLHVD